MEKVTGLSISFFGIILLVISTVAITVNTLFFKIIISGGLLLIVGGPMYTVIMIKYNKKRKVKLEKEGLLLEVFFVRKNGKHRAMGYVDQNLNFLYNNFKLGAYIEDNVLYFWNKELIFNLKKNEEIYDGDNKYLGAIKDFQIYNDEGTLYYTYNRNLGRIEDYSGEMYLQLKGNISAINHIVLLGIMFTYADLFC